MSATFERHRELLQSLLDGRQTIVERIEQHLLNVQGKDLSRSRNRAQFDQVFNASIFGLPGLPPERARLKGQLAAAHRADGFEPVPLGPYSQELDPLELVPRAYQHWEHRRWPGRSGRLAFADTLFAVFLLRHLEWLSLRVWDDGDELAATRADDVQALLDQLNAPSRAAAFARRAGWLMQTAQGTLTRHLGPYFRVAQHVADSLDRARRLECHAAGAKLGGGHLRSQLRYRSWEADRGIDDLDVLAVTRNSNSLDVALLVWDLVPLLEAYRSAREEGNRDEEDWLVDAILQGLSADPELLVVRLDLLTPCTMIEDLFVARDEAGVSAYSPLGARHVGLLARYRSLLDELAPALAASAGPLDPGASAYSPFGIAYGFCADVLSSMAMDSLLSQPSHDLTLEDMFDSFGRHDEKLARAAGWAGLPRRAGEREHFHHSIDWAQVMFARLKQALNARARHPHQDNASDHPRTHIIVALAPQEIDALPPTSMSAQQHCVTSDWQRALSGAETGLPKSQILMDRNEARFLASAEAEDKWFGVSKVVITMCLAQGKDAVITGVPQAVVDVLRLTCPDLVVADEASSA